MMSGIKIVLMCDEAETAFGRARRAKAFLERVQNPTLFENPYLEEDAFTSAYYDLPTRAKILAQRQPRQNQ
jgi:hypothetical protein